MILFVEGPRACGKTYLINDLLESVNLELLKSPEKFDTDPDIEYYKFYFANHIRTLGLHNIDNAPDLHYFSLGNIMTILEMNQQPQYRDKIWIFDRAIISAYVWAVLRQRLLPTRARQEYEALLSSDLYRNCKTIMITVNQDRRDQDLARNKDVFDGAHSTDEELHQFGHFLEFGKDHLADPARKNDISFITNNFDQESVDRFVAEGKKLLGISA